MVFTRLLFLALFMMSPVLAKSQILSKMFVEVDVIQQRNLNPYYSWGYNNSSLTYLNGFVLGIKDARDNEYFLRIRRINFESFYSTGHTAYDINGKGFDFDISKLYKIFRVRKLSLLIGPDFFWEKVKFSGIHYTDGGPPFETDINHSRNYLGGAAIIKVQFDIYKSLSVVYEIRGRTGIELYSSSNTVIINNSNWFSDINLINMVGLRYTLQ